MSDPMDKRTCGDCCHHDAHRRICALNLSYAAFVYTDSEAGDCPGYHAKERAQAEQQQSACRGYWATYWTGVK